MLSAPPRVTFSEYAVEVQDMVDHGLSLADVEGAVADADLTEESKAALWLLAWSSPRRDGWRPRAGAARSPAPFGGGALAFSLRGGPVPLSRG